MCDTYDCNYLTHTTFRFYFIDFQLNTDFPSQFCIFLLQNHLALLKDQFLKKMLLKSAKNLYFWPFLPLMSVLRMRTELQKCKQLLRYQGSHALYCAKI